MIQLFSTASMRASATTERHRAHLNKLAKRKGPPRAFVLSCHDFTAMHGSRLIVSIHERTTVTRGESTYRVEGFGGQMVAPTGQDVAAVPE